MANELPEVVPAVQNMPTTGWFYQAAQGSARRRVAKNKGSATNGIFDVVANGKLIFSKDEEQRFPEHEEIISALRALEGPA